MYISSMEWNQILHSWTECTAWRTEYMCSSVSFKFSSSSSTSSTSLLLIYNSILGFIFNQLAERRKSSIACILDVVFYKRLRAKLRFYSKSLQIRANSLIIKKVKILQITANPFNYMLKQIWNISLIHHTFSSSAIKSSHPNTV